MYILIRYRSLESDQFCQKHVVIPDIIEAELVMQIALLYEAKPLKELQRRFIVRHHIGFHSVKMVDFLYISQHKANGFAHIAASPEAGIHLVTDLR